MAGRRVGFLNRAVLTASRWLAVLVDILLLRIVIVAALMMRLVRPVPINRLPRTLKVFRKWGLWPPAHPTTGPRLEVSSDRPNEMTATVGLKPRPSNAASEAHRSELPQRMFVCNVTSGRQKCRL